MSPRPMSIRAGFPCLRLAPELPGFDEILGYLREAALPSVAQRMAEARARGRAVVQPRCGVGSLEGMRACCWRSRRARRPKSPP